MTRASTHGLLAGWKTIAAYFNRDERTVMRWAATRGLPVRRGGGAGRSTVYADPAELEVWLRGAEASEAAADHALDPPLGAARPAPSTLQRWTGLAALTLALVLAVVAFWRSPARPDTSADLPADPAARGGYLQATYDWDHRTASSLARAAGEFGDVIARDPRFAPAYVGLANTYLLIREYGAMPDSDAYPRAAAAAQAAVALSPSSAEAHRALAFIAFWWRDDRATARREFAEAIRLKPNDPLTHQWLATAMSANGEAEGALRQINIARSLNPVSSATLANYLELRYLDRRGADDLSALQSLEQSEPDLSSVHRLLADIGMFEGRPADYLRETALDASLRHDAGENRDRALLQRRYDEGGAPALSDALVAQARASRSPMHDFQLARALAVTGHGDEAATVLARACRDKAPGTITARADLWLSRSIPRTTIDTLCEVSPIGL